MSYDYRADFPESLYPAIANKDMYYALVDCGYQFMSRMDVYICAVARNVAKVSPMAIPRIERLGSLFNSYRVYVFENDSEDNSKSILQKWSDRNDRVLTEHETLNLPDLRGTEPERLVRMAYCRNKYLSHLQCARSTDFVIILDFDVDGGWSYHGIANSFGYIHQKGYNIIGSNSIIYKDRVRMFYDAWAYRRLGHDEAHLFVETNLLQYNRGELPFKVNSAFGGLAIYRADLLNQGVVKYEADDCDHPTLHKQLRALGHNIYLNPSQITLYNKHEYCI